MKKLFSLILAAIILSALMLPVFSASYLEEIYSLIEAPVAYMVSLDETGTVLIDINSDEKCVPAALVKIAAGIVVIENTPDTGALVTVEAEPLDRLKGSGAVTCGLKEGDELTVQDLLYCMLIGNANDAANVLAYFVAGGYDAFIAKMNEKASVLGLTGTHFHDCNGFEYDDQYTTAKDVAVLFSYCMDNHLFSEIMSVTQYEIPEGTKFSGSRYIKNTNYLMNGGFNDYYSKYVIGGKSAITMSEKTSVVSVASRDGYSYLCVIMDADYIDIDDDDVTENMAFVSSKRAFAWAFEKLKFRVIANNGSYSGEIPVLYSKEFDYVSLVPGYNITALVPASVTADSVLIEIDHSSRPENVKAPVKSGDYICDGLILYGGEVIAKIPLVAAFDIHQNAKQTLKDKISAFFGAFISSLAGKIIIALLVLIILVVIFIIISGGSSSPLVAYFRTKINKNKRAKSEIKRSGSSKKNGPSAENEKEKKTNIHKPERK